MSLSVAQMIDKIRKRTGISSDDLDDTALTLNLNMSWWEIASKFEFREKESQIAFNTVNGTVLYNAPNPFEAIQMVSIEDSNSKQHTPLRFMENDEYETNFVNSSDARGMPTRYFRRGIQLGLWPTPDAAYTIYEDYLTTLADLVATAAPIPQEWHESILNGGIYRSFLDVGDRNSAAFFIKHQANMVNTTPLTKEKEEKTNMKWAGLSVPRRWPDDSPVTGRRIN